MHIRTFRAANLQAALADIRRQMGPTASVLHTRQVRDGWLGWLGRTQVEVTAGLSDQPAVGSDIVSSRSGAVPGGVDIRSVAHNVDSDGSATSDLSSRTVFSERVVLPMGPTSLGTSRGEDLPATLAAYQSEFVSLGVPFAIAKRWVEATISFQAGFGDNAHPGSWVEPLQQSVARNLRVSGPIQTRIGQRHVVALIGPTGVGKTTTVAKLAAGFRIESKRRVGLLTIDTFRIAAVEQLKAYAQIMDLPMEVVEGKDDMRPALHRLGDVDLVLIDTAGRSPRSDARIEQLVGFLDAAAPDETHLVLSATSSSDSIAGTLEGFAPARPTSAILTKLDEAPHTAAVLAALEQYDLRHGHPRGGLPLSYVTHGQQVPDDISVASGDELVARLLPVAMSGHYMEAA